ncbi:type IV pilus modification PilV family protein [Psychrobacillus psychrotolerans]|uniref:type IV pilus modification PilV family protein n=1 Tax=Psychrobacillus psychrotolerans TaxID=126156 RepID=UPI003B015F9F
MKNLNYFNNQKGITLMEILAALVITAFISLLATNILLNGIERYNKITQDTFLRDESDYLMSQLIKEIYTTKSSNIIGVVNPTVNSSDSFLQIKTGDTQTNKTGFIKNTNTGKVEVVIKNQPIPMSNRNVLIDPTSKIILQNDGGYLIILKLELKNKVAGFHNIVYSIQDSIENEEEG